MERAAMLYGAAAALRETAGVTLQSDKCTDYERTLAELRSTVEEERFVAAWDAGRIMALEQAIAYALGG